MCKSFRIVVMAFLFMVAWGATTGTYCHAGMFIYMAESGDSQPLLECYGIVPDTSVEMDIRVLFDEYGLLLYEGNGFGSLYQFSPSSGENPPLWQASWVEEIPPGSIFGDHLSSAEYSTIFYKNVEEGGLYLDATMWTPQNAGNWDGTVAPGDYLLGRVQITLDASTEIGTEWNFQILSGLTSYEVIDAEAGESLDFTIIPGGGDAANLLTFVASETPGSVTPALPEPSTWAMLMGVSLVGSLVLRRRQAAL